MWQPLGRVTLLCVPLLTSACAAPHLPNPFSAGSAADSPPQGVTADHLLANAKADAGDEISPSGDSLHCPEVVAWPNDRLLTVYQAGHVGDSTSIVHRGEITKIARECEISANRVVVKYGFAGRVLLGPKGQAGVVTLPVSVHAAGVDHKVLATDAMKITVTVPAGDPVGYFSMVKELSFPVATGSRPEDYKIFVGFEHNVPNAG